MSSKNDSRGAALLDDPGDVEHQDGCDESLYASLAGALEVFAPLARENPENHVAWHAFVEGQSLARPDMPSFAEYQRWDVEKRVAFDDARKRYHSGFGPIRSAVMKKVHETLMRLAFDNLSAPPGARQGGILDGPGTLGKTTILLHLGRIYERKLRPLFEDAADKAGIAEFVPVVYVSVPSSTTPKKLLTSLCQFYGEPISYRDSETTLKDKLRACVRACGTSLILLDDIHNLHRGNKSAESVNDLIKELANKLPVTFVHAGINCENSVLLMDGKTGVDERFTQTQYRFTLFQVQPFTYDVDQPESEWLSLLDVMESHLRLFKYEKGALRKQKSYLYARTQGGMGNLSRLIRGAANHAIRTGEEQLKKTVFDAVELPYAAEVAYGELLARLNHTGGSFEELFTGKNKGKKGK